MKNTILFVTILILVSCQREPSTHLIQYLTGTPTNFSLPDNIIISSLLSLPEGFLAIAADGKGLILFSNEFEVIKHYEKTGFGPGELQKISRLNFLNNQILVVDSEKRSIEIFDKQLNFIQSILPKDRILDAVFADANSVIGLAFTMNNWSLIKFSGQDFSETEVIFSQSTRSPEQGVGQLTINGDYISFNRVFTNQTTIISYKSGGSFVVTNNALPQRAEMISAPMGAVPKGPVFLGGRLSESSVLHYAQNKDTGGLSIFKLDFNSRIKVQYDLDILPEALSIRNDTLFALSNENVILYFIQNHD
jgi:hypothetical protein